MLRIAIEERAQSLHNKANEDVIIVLYPIGCEILSTESPNLIVSPACGVCPSCLEKYHRPITIKNPPTKRSDMPGIRTSEKKIEKDVTE